ncbi:MAG: tetratricopeptide repeat protein [Polyangiales bacterium]
MKSVAVVIFLLGFAGQARAQATEAPEVAQLPSDDELADVLASSSMTAERAYDIGARLFAVDRYEVAELAWLRAYSLSRDPVLLVAVADTRERRGDDSGAVAMLEKYLAERPDAPDRLAIEARLAALLRRPAKLLIRSPQPGRAILLDGVPLERRTPAEVEVEPGLHTVAVAGEGTLMGQESFQVAYGEVKELDFSPVPPSEMALEETDEARLGAQLQKEREDLTIRRAVISTGSIAAAALVPGTVLCVLAANERNDSNGGTTDKGDRLLLFAEASFGLAALSAITSFTLFMTHKNRRARERESARLRIDARGAGATVRFRF